MISKDVQDALDKYEFRLKRQKKHLIFENPAGRTLTISKTPSDYRAEARMLQDIKRASQPPELKPKIPSTASLPKQNKPRPGQANSSGATGGFTYIPTPRITVNHEQRQKDRLNKEFNALRERCQTSMRHWEYHVKESLQTAWDCVRLATIRRTLPEVYREPTLYGEANHQIIKQVCQQLFQNFAIEVRVPTTPDALSLLFGLHKKVDFVLYDRADLMTETGHQKMLHCTLMLWRILLERAPKPKWLDMLTDDGELDAYTRRLIRYRKDLFK